MNAQSVSYTGDGSTTTFAFPFPLLESLELEVVVDSVAQVSGFAILGGEGVTPGGAVVFATAPASGKPVILRRIGKVQVSGTDAPGFLEAKLVAGANVSVTKTTDASGEHLSVAAAANPADFLAKAQNLADLPNAATARGNLGLAAVAASGSYNDLSNKPGLGSAAALDVGTAALQVVQLDSSARLPAVDGSQLTNIPVGEVQTDGTDAVGYLQDKVQGSANVTVTKSAGKMVFAAPNMADKTQNLADLPNAATARGNLGLAAVAASGSYNDLSGKPSLGSAAALNVDTDATLAANSDSLLPSQKAVKAYADAKVATILSSTNFASLEQDLAQTYLLSAMTGGWSTGLLANGAYDAFNSDTIGANSTNQTYDSVDKTYLPNPASYSSNIFSGSTAIESGHFNSNVAANAFDGNTAVYWQGAISNTSGANWIGYQLSTPQTLTRIGIYLDSTHQGYTEHFDLQYSDNGSLWETATSGLVVPNTGWSYFTFNSVGAHVYWRLLSTDNNVGYPVVGEFQGYTTQSSTNMTLVSNALSPAPASTPTQVKLLVLWRALDASTLNTDLTVEATRDGSTWTAGTLTDTGYTANGDKLLWATVDVSAQSSGTTVKYRLKTFNGKNQQIKGAVLMVK